MSLLHYLQLQPVDPHDDGSRSDLDTFAEDETIDLTSDISEQELDQNWERILKDMHGKDAPTKPNDTPHS